MSEYVFLNGKRVENPHESHHHISPVIVYVAVFAALLVLTGISYAVSFANLGPGSLPVAQALTMYGAPLDGWSAMWVFAEGTLYALVERDSSWTATPQRDDLEIIAMCADQRDHLWLLDEAGDVQCCAFTVLAQSITE